MDDCWLWAGEVNSRGYGYLHGGHDIYVAHRAVYEDMVGPIPSGLFLDHLCGNRICVNPAHLEPVTNKVNLMRGNGICANNARKTHCKYGHLFDEENTRMTRQGHRKCLACTRRRSLARYAL